MRQKSVTLLDPISAIFEFFTCPTTCVILMTVLRTDIVRALDELSSQEEGMRFQGLAIVLGKKHWPELVARQRKKDFGLDAYAPGNLSLEKVGKGLAASITPTLAKISEDARTAKEHFPDLGMLMFVTSAKVGNADRQRWEAEIFKKHDLQLLLIEREEIIIQMMMPENASLCASVLHLTQNVEPDIVELTARTKRAANSVTSGWAVRTKGFPLIDLAAERLGSESAQSGEVLSIEQIAQLLLQSRRVVLEGAAGRGKTTTLIQLAQKEYSGSLTFIVELPAWTSSRRGIFEFIAGMPAYQAEGLSAIDLARVQQATPVSFFLNGWNEINESTSVQAIEALRELERDFPSAGMIVATRTHHVMPPLPGAIRMRLLTLGNTQRSAYLDARLGEKSVGLRTRIQGDPLLDELTRTPFILAEVASLFDAGVDIPSTKMDILAEVLRLQESREEHKNALQMPPLFGLQTPYLKALAREMIRNNGVELRESEARRITASALRELIEMGLTEQVGAPRILATLTAHHVLERVDYPQTTFQFEHQQIQEYYAALDVRVRLLAMGEHQQEKTSFTTDYVNVAAWAEPLRMIAQTFAQKTGSVELDEKCLNAGKKLVLMALSVDAVFAGELARLCGQSVWREVRCVFSEQCRALYKVKDVNYQHCALAAMLATGFADFSDIVVGLLSGSDSQARHSVYRLWPDIQVESLSSEWRKLVSGWREDAQADFISVLLHQRADDEVVRFAAQTDSVEVKRAAAEALLWTGADEAMNCVLQSMTAKTFENFVQRNAEQLLEGLRPKAIAALQASVKTAQDGIARLQTLLKLIELGVVGLDEVLKDTIEALDADDVRKLDSYYLEPAIRILRKNDSEWGNVWLTSWIAKRALAPDHWLPFVTAVPEDVISTYLLRLETEDLSDRPVDGVAAVIVHIADVKVAARLFLKLEELNGHLAAESDDRHETVWRMMRQIEAILRRFPHDLIVAGILTTIQEGQPPDIRSVTGLLSKVARTDEAPLCVVDADLKLRLRTYLLENVGRVMQFDDFSGAEKANLASSIAQIGDLQDMDVLLSLVHADIERVRRGRAARAAGDRGPIGNGATMSYAGWHVRAIVKLHKDGAERVLLDLLCEPEYVSPVADAMAHDFLPILDQPFGRTFRYDLMWAAREGSATIAQQDPRRSRFAEALSAEIERLRMPNQRSNSVPTQKILAKALAVIDGRVNSAQVIQVMAQTGTWDQHIALETAELLLMAGAVLPVTSAFKLIDSVLERTASSMQESDRYLLRRSLMLCPFVDDPAAGFGKMKEVIGKRMFWEDELHAFVSAVGESRAEGGVDFLLDLYSSYKTLEEGVDTFVVAFGKLDTPRARELLLSLVDPDIAGIPLKRLSHRENIVIGALAGLAKRSSMVENRLHALCQKELPKLNRHLLSNVMGRLGSVDAFIANLDLIDDANSAPVPGGVWLQLESTFVERRADVQEFNLATLSARASNELRSRIFRMACDDPKRAKSAIKLLGQIEAWRLEYGRPTDEPRHPNLASGKVWPPNKDVSDAASAA